MKISEKIVTLIGIALAVVGFCILLLIVNLHVFGIEFNQFGLPGQIVAGVLFLGVGIYIIRGGNVDL